MNISTDINNQMISWRRYLHRFPEPGWLEVRSSAFVAGRLRDLGYEVLMGDAVCRSDLRMAVPDEKTCANHYEQVAALCDPALDPADLLAAKDGHTGVIGILYCGEGPTVALRFDMDALPVTESTQADHFPCKEGFSSTVPGTMHACGHDCHMAIGLGTALLLSNMRSQLKGTVKLIFQPAEEGVRGAASIASNHHLDDVDYLLAGHVMPSKDQAIYAAPGMEQTLATTKLQATFHGRAAHASTAPQEGNNALLAAAGAVLQLHAIPRHAGGESRINVGAFHAGKSANVICDEATLLLEVRGETSEINRYMEQSARRILTAAAAGWDCNVDIETLGYAGTVRCSDVLTAQIQRICTETLHVNVRPSPGLHASEDYSCMTEAVLAHGGQTCFIGFHVPAKAPLHNPHFDPDEACLELGASVFAETVKTLLN